LAYFLVVSAALIEVTGWMSTTAIRAAVTGDNSFFAVFSLIIVSPYPKVFPPICFVNDSKRIAEYFLKCLVYLLQAPSIFL